MESHWHCPTCTWVLDQPPIEAVKDIPGQLDVLGYCARCKLIAVSRPGELPMVRPWPKL